MDGTVKDIKNALCLVIALSRRKREVGVVLE